ncbi:MAG: tryptophan--tRNA ligase [Bdellovibrionota bacterium]
MPFSQLVFSGVQPSGAQVHLGNYLGAMKRFVTLSEKHDTMFCLVDLHALTSVEEPEQLRSYTTSLAASYLAIGLDPKKAILFRQSDVPEVCELSWYLACQFPLGLLERAHKLKDSRAKNINVNSGLMFYPILMAADILLYRGTQVPVGADQKQHLEMSREIAQRFNSHYGRELFPVPEPLIEADTGVIPGLDGRKMSKSYNNYIGLFEEPKALKEKVMRIVTDSKTVEEPKDPESCNIFKLYKLVASAAATEALAARYRSGGMGYGHAKQELLAALTELLTPLRERYQHWMSQPDELNSILDEGASKARKIAQKTMADVRAAVGIAASN